LQCAKASIATKEDSSAKNFWSLVEDFRPKICSRGKGGFIMDVYLNNGKFNYTYEGGKLEAKAFKQLTVYTVSGNEYLFTATSKFSKREIFVKDNKHFVKLTKVSYLGLHNHATKSMDNAVNQMNNIWQQIHLAFVAGGSSIITSKIAFIEVIWANGEKECINIATPGYNDVNTVLENMKLYDYGSESFRQFSGKTLENMPEQGIKLHISCRGDYDDYLNMVRAIVPTLKAAGLTFKIVKPERFVDFTAGGTEASQQGKIITIYPAKGDFVSALNKLWPILNDGFNVIPVQGDKHLFGRVYARYGGLTKAYVKDAYGNIYQDDKNKPFPSFISDISLSDFMGMTANN
jgi:hypothetical protein